MKYFRTGSAPTSLQWSRFSPPNACLVLTRLSSRISLHVLCAYLRNSNVVFRFLILAPDDVDGHYRRPFIKWKGD